MNIFSQEFKMQLKSLLSYTIGILLTFYLFVSLFNIISADTAILDAILANFPKEFKAAFGFADVSLSEINGYLSFLYSYVILIGAVYSMKLSVTVLSEETRAKTADFLLSKPVQRYQIVTAKLSAVLLSLIVQNILVFCLCLPAAWIVDASQINLKFFILLSGSMFLVQLFFVGIGIFVSVLLKKIKSVMPITLGVVFMFYIIEMINQSLMEQKLTYFSPFSYFRGSELLSNLHFDLKYVVLDLTIFIILLLMSYGIYQRKDIHAV